jgi:hypothetical protein
VGDTHNSLEFNKLSFKYFPEGRNLTKDDYVIVCGDAGFIWNNNKEDLYWQNWLEDRPFTVLACLGNHEGYDLIRQLPAEEWNGGIVRKVRPHVMYLENGYVFNLNGFKTFVMGGATSQDKAFRTEHISWWREEMPTYTEMQRGIDNLAANNYKVDLILSHCAPDHIVQYLFNKTYCGSDKDALTTYLEEEVYQKTEFKRWYCGHYHTDRCLEEGKFNILYNDFEEVLPNCTTKTYESGFKIV